MKALFAMVRKLLWDLPIMGNNNGIQIYLSTQINQSFAKLLRVGSQSFAKVLHMVTRYYSEWTFDSTLNAFAKFRLLL